MKWYVARTKAGREFSSARNLMADGIGVYCPALAVRGPRRPLPAANARGASRDQVNDDPFAGKVPMLRGYVFVRPADARQMAEAAHARGVVELIGGASPAPVADTAMALVRQTEAEQAALGMVPLSGAAWMPEIGQRIRVISGSYVGQWGTVIGGDQAKSIVHLLVHIFGALRPAWIAVEALDRDTAHFEEEDEAQPRRSYLKREGRQKPAA